MRPRSKPTTTHESAEAVAELKEFGALQKHKPGIAQVIVFWQDHGRPCGLPENWLQDGVVSRDGVDWKIYLRRIGSFYVGFCEAVDGTTLRLLMIKPVKAISKNDALMTLRARV